MRVGRGALIAAVAAGLTALAAAPAGALAPPTGWNGANPFNCDLQYVGSGTAFPHPDADPFCVDFDKRRQNVTDLGVVDFLSQEPARVAAAVPKCFYFQSDHWRGSVVQDDGSAVASNDSAGGTRVVFPAPGGARSTAQGLCWSAATTCGRTSSIGSGRGVGTLEL